MDFCGRDRKSPVIIIWFCLLLLSMGRTAQAGKDDVDAIDFAFQRILRDGFFIGTQEDVEVFDLPLKYRLLRTEEKGSGLVLNFPLCVGLYNIESEDEDIDADILAIVPGIEFQFPILKNWIPMPFGDFGVGKDVSRGKLRYIYGMGLESHLLFEWKRLDFIFGNALRNTGYFTHSGGPDDNISSFDTGLDMRFPLGFTLWEKSVYLSFYGVNYSFHFDSYSIIRPAKILLLIGQKLTISTKARDTANSDGKG